MAKILGNLEPEDDYTHELGPEPNFNESMYFNFFDGASGIGGFIRLGNRANEGHAEMTVTLYLPDGRVLFNFQRPEIRDNSAFAAGGVRFEVLEPTQRLRTVYSGSMVELIEPRDMADPRKAFTDNPRREVSLELIHEAVGPMYGSVGPRAEAGRSDENQFARAHYEQHMHVTGQLVLAGERYEIDGYGLRDHSWGPRTWQSIHSYEWLTMNFGAEMGVMVSIIRTDPETERQRGVVVRGDRFDLIREARIDAEYESNGLFHRSLRVHFQTHQNETFEIEGQVKSFIPLRNRKGRSTTHIGEGMTEWRTRGLVGQGLSEFLRQL